MLEDERGYPVYIKRQQANDSKITMQLDEKCADVRMGRPIEAE